MGILRNFCFALLLCVPFVSSAQVSISTNVLNFFTVFTGEKDSLDLTITNNSNIPFDVTGVGSYLTDAFSVDQTAFSVPVGGTHTIKVYCEPVQNVRTADWLMIKSSSHPIVLSTFLFAFVRHIDPYYDLTFDKYHEDLKAALKTLISFGYTDLGYNPARDAMFMQVDNKATNGQGATQNTLECVYTGTTAVGFTNRGDAQNNYNFNTEHVFPQSLFNELQPMRSDIHHLLPSTASSNGERSNKPFGVVSNPSWTSGGSKSNGSTFEPRNQSKGDVARAMMYFVIRYQDFNGFMAPQEAILRQWNKQHLPDSLDIARNDIIFGLQSNRNPFVDHPEFCDRIASLTSTNTGPSGPIAFDITDSLNFGNTGGSPTIGYYRIANKGINDLQLSNFSFSSTDFTLMPSPNTIVPKDSVRTIRIQFQSGAVNSVFNETLTFNTNDPAKQTVTLHLYGDTFVGREAPKTMQFEVYPQPANDKIAISFGQSPTQATRFQVYNLAGQQVVNEEWDGNGTVFELGLQGLAPGMYLMKVANADEVGQSRIVKQ